MTHNYLVAGALRRPIAGHFRTKNATKPYLQISFIIQSAVLYFVRDLMRKTSIIESKRRMFPHIGLRKDRRVEKRLNSTLFRCPFRWHISSIHSGRVLLLISTVVQLVSSFLVFPVSKFFESKQANGRTKVKKRCFFSVKSFNIRAENGKEKRAGDDEKNNGTMRAN